MNMYTFEQLKQDVAKEAQALRVHATVEERERLTVEGMDPNNTYKCYYGLMTGYCDSPRAAELIQKCTCTYIDGLPGDLNGVTVGNEFAEYRWSPIEMYITLPEANNVSLISYLRGETETLEL
jgi:hypothetical protein